MLKEKDRKRINRFLERRGCRYLKSNWTFDELDRFLDENRLIDFDGFEAGSIKFNTTKSGRRYITFTSERCYID